MRLTIFGASGLTGTCLVSQALGPRSRRNGVRAHTGLSRAKRIRTSTSSLEYVASATDVERVVNGQDVVMMSLGGEDGPLPDQVCTIATATIVPAMQKFGVRRLALNVSGRGHRRGAQPVDRARQRW
jgi:putative NADH-flavin reductase